LGSGISSPVSSMPPLIAVQTGLAPAVFQLAASDPNGRPLTYRLATAAEMGGVGLVQPTGLTINPTSGMVSFNTVGKPVGNLFNGSFVVSDGLASIWVDVLMNIVAQSTAPQFNYSITPANGFTYNLQPGQNVNFNVNAFDALATDMVTLQALGLPAGAVLTPNLPVSGNPVQTHFNWTPTIANLGSRLVNFVATDINGVQTSTSVTINVTMNPVFDTPPTPDNNSTVCIQRGEAFSYTVQAHAPDPNVTLQITAVTDGFPGVVHTPVVPTPAGNTSSTVFSGTASGFGSKHFAATATDNLGHSTSTSWDLLVDVPPAFSSTPTGLTITQNQPFSYAVTVTDPDVILGDTVEIHGVIIPSWMTFTQTGPTTAILSGNPGTSNVGTFHVQLNASDLFEHCYAPVAQSFDILVNACSFTETISASPSATNNCPGTSVVLTAAAANSYSWNTGDSTQSITVTAGTASNYTVNAQSAFCSASASILVQGIDTVAPVAICQNITANLDATGNASITAAQVNNGSSDACGIASMTVSPNTFTCANVGPNAVTLTVTDVNGNVSTCTSTVTVQDLIAPVAICQNITANLDATGNASITAAQVNNGSSDACGIASMTVSPNTFTCANVGPNAVTLTVTDVNGNVSTCSSTVTVQDLIAPVAICQNITVNLDATGNASITAAQLNNGSSDACGIASMTVSPNTFTCANVGPNAVTLTVTDVNGNVSTCTSTVTVQDLIAPVATCRNTTVTLDASGHATVLASQINNGSTDNCGIVSMSVSPSSFTCANFGANPVTLTVTDAHGNSSTCTATVTVQDNTPPVANCHNATIYLDASGHAVLTAAQVNNGSTDNCGIASVTVSPASFTCANVGTNPVTLTVTDVHGNVSTCTASVTVVDNIPPTVSCKNVTVTLVNGAATITAAQVTNSSSDNCGIASLKVSPSAFTCANIGANTVTLTATDTHGNSSTCQSVVTVVGKTASCTVTASHTCDDNVFTGGDPTHIYLGYGPQTVTLNVAATGGTTFTYSWTGTGLSSTTSATPVFKPTTAGVYTFTVTSTNNYGCSSTCSISICVLDVRVPKSCNMVYLCHVPPGKPSNAQTLSISTSAVEAHLKNHVGDHLGQCNQVCGTTKEEMADATIIDEMGDLSVLAYPNPFSEGFHVRIESANTETITIRLYSVTGQLMEAQEHVTSESEISLGHNIPNGLYFLEVQQGESKKVVKVQKIE
jgi:hypothetical protein